nr:hypothetical protein [Azospirillum sp. SYSU D00513]
MVLGIALLGGAGFGGWKLYTMYLVEGEAAPPPPPPPPPTSFVRMSSVVVPVIGAAKVEQFVTVVVTLEVIAEKAPVVQANQPRLSDAFLTALYGALDDKSVLNNGIVDIAAVKGKLKETAGKTVGEGLVTDVLLQVVMQRNL